MIERKQRVCFRSLLHGVEEGQLPKLCRDAGILVVRGDSGQGLHGILVIAVGFEAHRHQNRAAVRHGVGADAALDFAAVVGGAVKVGQRLDLQDLACGLPDGAGAVLGLSSGVGGDESIFSDAADKPIITS